MDVGEVVGARDVWRFSLCRGVGGAEAGSAVSVRGLVAVSAEEGEELEFEIIGHSALHSVSILLFKFERNCWCVSPFHSGLWAVPCS